MRVLVLDTLLEQANNGNRRMPADVLPRIYKEYRKLAELEKEGYNAIYEYLTKNNNGKHMKGVSDITIFKYDLTDGDRILYTYGKELPFLQKEKDSLVLLGYSNHDRQGSIAKRVDFKNESHEFAYLANVVKNLNCVSPETESLSEEELRDIASFLLAESFTGYAYSDEELCQFSIDEIENHLYLSEEQKEVITDLKIKRSPTLIMGGAGTGKTLIAVHLLNNIFNDSEDISIAYFTQSAYLLEKVKEQYKQLRGQLLEQKKSKVDFFDINKFCLDIIGLSEESLIRTHQFMDEFMKGYLMSTSKGLLLLERLEKNNISYDNVWTEIRGTIKGGMKNWIRVSPMNQDNVTFNINKYVTLGYVERLDNNKKLFQLCDTVQNTVKKMKMDERLDWQDKKVINTIVSHFSTFDHSLKSLPLDSYMSLGDEFSVLGKEQREIVVDIFHEYENFLGGNRVDENDIIRKVFELNLNRDRMFDFIFVDEIQDYTELQIYFLSELVKDKNNIVFAGDPHQIINPTLFSVSKLKELFNNNENNNKIEEKFLHTNFRCQKGVVNIANNLSYLRRHYIGSQLQEMEQEEKSNVNICLYDPYRLEYNEMNIRKIMLEIIKYPQVAVLVPDIINKKFLLEYVKDYERPDFIFTVDEIKGMEYDYVVCFNLFDYYYDEWQSIINSNIKSYRTKFRFYFNLIYVAITRAKKMLCFIDRKTLHALESELKLKNEKDFDSDLLHFSDLDSSSFGWLKQAEDYKKKGMFKNALQFYQMAKDDADVVDVYDCYIGLSEEERNYEVAIKYSILKSATLFARNKDLEKNNKKITSYTKILDDNLPINQIAKFVTESKNFIPNFAQIIEKEFNAFDETERDVVSNYYLNCLELLMVERLENKRIPKL